MKVCSRIAALAFAVGAPLTLAAQQSPAATTPSAPPGFEIPKDMTTYHMAIQLHPAMLPSMASLVVKY